MDSNSNKDKERRRCRKNKLGSEQPDLNDNEGKLIKAALRFFSGKAANWATPYLWGGSLHDNLLEFSHHQELFNGRWEDFKTAFTL
ncbi:hypothetical protein J3R30DRAFT_3580744 [Lentinula aciculospora]|uniref:Uncharacterized protein n=1 Tax=Lentinula aciculospora TaxID=153920 RepID=A0A9W9DFK0_9AGAR|nr:hypothetical protein J3R30DRAFT_3580744 [Lentinula aciculospora]